MDRPSPQEKGAVYIRTLFGEVSEHWFPDKSRRELIEDAPWRATVRAEGGPFCYTDPERLMPF